MGHSSKPGWAELRFEGTILHLFKRGRKVRQLPACMAGRKVPEGGTGLSPPSKAVEEATQMLFLPAGNHNQIRSEDARSAAIFSNKISTEQQSLVLVKRLLAIAVSCITYLRGIFPECAYGTRYLDDLCVKILKEDKNCPSSSQLVKWMLGCYDALQKKYVYTNQEDPQTVTECYQFKFKYTGNGPLMDFTSKNQGSNSNITCADTKKASILLIRKIYVLMQNLGPLPDDVCLTMKLFYYDEVTPPDYQPPGFKEGDCDGIAFEGEPMYLSVGEVPTPFHLLKVKVTTEKERMENVDKAILKQSISKNTSKAQNPEERQDQKMDIHSAFLKIFLYVYFMQEDFTAENKTREKKNTDRILHDGELNLVCKEDESIRAEDSQTLSICSSQVEQLVNKTKELEVAESKTRSGKRFQCNTGGIESTKKPLAAKRPIEAPKKSGSQPGKPVYDFEFSSSQDSSPKRRNRVCERWQFSGALNATLGIQEKITHVEIHVPWAFRHWTHSVPGLWISGLLNTVCANEMGHQQSFKVGLMKTALRTNSEKIVSLS
ncbi:HORMA domain-containing protein 1 [Varanus komodoensis]|nr:HORMA domain-containing protein 1 [Varanus komodoensis]